MYRRNGWMWGVLFAVAVGYGLAAEDAALKLPSIIGENMVLQAGKPLPIWGWAKAGQEVTVTVAGQTKKATAVADGKWRVNLDALQAGGPLEMTVAAGETLTLKNILVGEVWIGSGQSNMEMSVRSSRNSAEEAKGAEFPKIRLFTVAKKVTAEPQSDVSGKWVECSPATVPGFSAVLYFFGRHLHQTLKVPVGLIHTSWGGTPAQSWTSREMLASDPELKAYLDDSEKSIANYPEAKANGEKAVAAWKALPDGDPKKKGRAPQVPQDPRTSPWLPTSLFNGMINGLIPYAIQGAIWYQGESNAGDFVRYRKLFPAMITDWRQRWGEGDFPFFFVQLANFMGRSPQPSWNDWAGLREAQTMTLKLPKTGQAVIIDIGDEKDIHPKNKQDVGKRLALSAEVVAYGRDTKGFSPLFDTMKVDGSKARITFKYTYGGLVAKGGEPLKGFAIAGEDQKFVWADAVIDGETVVVSSPQVAKPVAVRYAWGCNPECNLYNKEDLPASPFRTDTWDRK